MAKKNPGDVLTCDWNPIIGCERYSEGCRNCWYLDGIFPWQQRLGNIPSHVQPNEPHVFDKRLCEDSLKAKKGIVGIVQHGDLFWDKVPDEVIHRVLDIIDDRVAKQVLLGKKKKPIPRYLLWTKRAKRAIELLSQRYNGTLPSYYGLAITVEDQATANERLPHLSALKGMKALVAEPLLGPIDIRQYIDNVDWVIVGSETGPNARPINHDWVRDMRDVAKAHEKPFFIKQLGNDHRNQQRLLDGLTWDEFPIGWVK